MRQKRISGLIGSHTIRTNSRLEHRNLKLYQKYEKALAAWHNGRLCQCGSWTHAFVCHVCGVEYDD